MRTDILKGDILHLDTIRRPVEGDEVAVSNGPEWPLTSSPNVVKFAFGKFAHYCGRPVVRARSRHEKASKKHTAK